MIETSIPQSIPQQRCWPNGQLKEEAWRIGGGLHRPDGPAYQEWHEDGQLRYEVWYIDGNLHRVDGPALQTWHENGQLFQEEWFVDGARHRLDGPAYQEWHDNGQLWREEWWIDGKKVEPKSTREVYRLASDVSRAQAEEIVKLFDEEVFFQETKDGLCELLSTNNDEFFRGKIEGVLMCERSRSYYKED